MLLYLQVGNLHLNKCLFICYYVETKYTKELTSKKLSKYMAHRKKCCITDQMEEISMKAQ